VKIESEDHGTWPSISRMTAIDQKLLARYRPRDKTLELGLDADLRRIRLNLEPLGGQYDAPIAFDRVRCETLLRGADRLRGHSARLPDVEQRVIVSLFES
jgi:hypothetical protein